ncbi:MAG: DNA polymerase III subunit gamma/tau [Spirochaetia bacterium]|nr:DNA polymerase III subunit gamma/tau [Spirochaetia bacterium]
MKSLALKYRPKTFNDLVGQIHASQSLKNAIEYKHIRQAYLFFGSRGVGKTSTARILSRCLNCVNGPTVEPCGTCSSCIEISEGRSVDVIEMDAASNRGIENIRELRENARFAPMKSKYKIYIIDEVHMLTNESFNALLKILEEPPGHVVFIMATTEQHKIPETIISRCQVFGFRKFSIQDIRDRLEYILNTEKIAYHKDSILPICQKAEGSMRDAVSLLDQAIAYSGNKPIDLEVISNLLGIHPLETYLEFVESFRNSDAKKNLLIIHRLFSEGLNLKRFIWDLLDFMKSMILVKNELLERENFSYAASEIDKLKKYADLWDVSELILVFESFYKLYSNWSLFQTSKSAEIKISLEIAVVDIFEKLKRPSVSKLMQKITMLKNAIEKGTDYVDETASSLQNNNEIDQKKDITLPRYSETVIDKENIKQKNDEKHATNDNNSDKEFDIDTLIQKEFMAQEQNDTKSENIFLDK